MGDDVIARAARPRHACPALACGVGGWVLQRRSLPTSKVAAATHQGNSMGIRTTMAHPRLFLAVCVLLSVCAGVCVGIAVPPGLDMFGAQVRVSVTPRVCHDPDFIADFIADALHQFGISHEKA